MFKNEIKERLEKHQTQILQDAVGDYASIMKHCYDLIKAYKDKNIRDILFHATSIDNYYNNLEIDIFDELSNIEQVLTGEEVYLDYNSFYNFLLEKQDYLEFRIYINDNGIHKYSGKNYKKEFQVERPDFPIYDFNISDINKKKKSLIEAIREDKIEPQIYVAQGESPTVILKDK